MSNTNSIAQDLKEEYQVPSNPIDRQKIKEAIQEAANSLMRIDAENDLKKDMAANMKDLYDMPPAVFNKLARAHHKKNIEEMEKKTEALTDNYSLLFGSNA